MPNGALIKRDFTKRYTSFLCFMNILADRRMDGRGDEGCDCRKGSSHVAMWTKDNGFGIIASSILTRWLGVVTGGRRRRSVSAPVPRAGFGSLAGKAIPPPGSAACNPMGGGVGVGRSPSSSPGFRQVHAPRPVIIRPLPATHPCRRSSATRSSASLSLPSH
jgi:hypothetical protein